MVRIGLRVCGTVCFVTAALAVWCARGSAVPLDKDGDIKLGVRTYVNARVGTEDTDATRSTTLVQVPDPPSTVKVLKEVSAAESRTYPYSAGGHLRQNRFYLEAELDHDLSRLTREGVGPFGLLNLLPFQIKGLKYHLTFRAEADGVYDWGPREFSTASQYVTGSTTYTRVPLAQPRAGSTEVLVENFVPTLPDNPIPGPNGNNRVDVLQARRDLRNRGTHRERLFQAYVEGSVGSLFVRFGRQILSWGETDGFRLLDQINPVDSSFGGFLISLDERRVPLDMLRLAYYIGDVGPISESSLELYAAIDDKVGFAPGTATGSPWTLPNLGAPSSTTLTILQTPHRTIGDTRGGGRLSWNMFDATFSVAHYYTYFDTPAVQVVISPPFPATFSDGFSAHAIQSAPLVQVSGATTTFALPSLFSVVRSEVAWFKGEPRFRQSELDPFVFQFPKGNPNPPITGGRRVGDSLNCVLGIDSNQWIRALNPNQTFFISTQFFYKHLNGVPAAQPFTNVNGQRGVTEGEVLPVPEQNIIVGGPPNASGFVPGSFAQFGAVEPSFIRQQQDQFLQTFFITTSFRSGTINPAFTFFYDWSGSMVYQPAIEFSHDPFRLSIDYSVLDAGRLKGNSGVSLLRDRDNIQFRFEYVI